MRADDWLDNIWAVTLLLNDPISQDHLCVENCGLVDPDSDGAKNFTKKPFGIVSVD